MRAPTEIRKRDGRLEPFRPEKVHAAIEKAFLATGAGADEAGLRATELAGGVLRKLAERAGMGARANAAPGVEEIQDLVERELIEACLPEVAKAYILYRQRRTDVRESKRVLGVEDDLHLTTNAAKVLERRYLRKDVRGEVVETPAEMMRRVARAVAAPEAARGGPEAAAAAAERFERALRDLDFLPNSPTLMNAGTALGNLAACFVVPVPDAMEGIFEAVKRMACIHQSGGGSGFSFSRLRPKNDVVASTGGIASGPVSFMTVFDAATEVVKQGGRRRGANMAILRVDHPDILEFVSAKATEGRLRNFNISVGATDAFMRAVAAGETYALVNPRTGEAVKRLAARDVFDLIVAMAWTCGDPGLVFLDAINRANPTPLAGEMEATNPCVSGETRVWVEERGWIPIAELVGEQPVVATENGGRIEFRRASRVLRTGVRPLFRLTTLEGYEIELTEDHRVATDEGDVPAGDLEPGDRIRLAVREAPVVSRESADARLGEVIGWLVGDGCFTMHEAGKPTVQLAFYGRDKREAAQRILDSVRRLIGDDRLSLCQVEERDVATIRSTRLRRILSDLGIEPTCKRDVPEALRRGSPDLIAGYLRGLFSADGSVQGSIGRGLTVRLASNEIAVLRGVQELLLRLGMKSRLYRNRRTAGSRSMPDGHGGLREYFCAAQHELAISSGRLRIFRDVVGFLIGGKEDALAAHLEGYTRGPYRESTFATFDELVFVREDEVFDLTEPESHRFVANGLVVHNCGEQPLLPYEACNLGSVNLARMVAPGPAPAVDWDRLGEMVDLGVRFLDDVIDAARYPFPEIDAIVRTNRKIGIGVMGWAEMLIRLGIPYTAPEALELADKVGAFIQDRAHAASRALAAERGPFPAFATSVWAGRGAPMRNATTTTIAPTGTISIIAGTTSGIEPLYAVAYVRNVLGGEQLLEVNPLFEAEAKRLGALSTPLLRRILREGSLARIPEVPEELRRLFVTAADVPPEWHVRMQAAFQRRCDNGVSKTVNLPPEATQADVRRAYELAWKLECKGITVFRSGSKSEQVLAQRSEAEAALVFPGDDCRTCAT